MGQWKIRTALGAVITLCAVMATSIAPAAASIDPRPGKSAEVQVLSSAEQAEVEQRFVDLGIDEEARPNLLAKLQRGQLPDSTTGSNELDSWTEQRHGESVTVVEYADGSRRISGVRPAVGTAHAGIMVPNDDNCEPPQGAGFWNWGPCEIFVEDAISYAGFTAAWVQTADHERFPAEITVAEGPNCQVWVLGSVTECDLAVDRWVASPDRDARATLEFGAELLDGLGGLEGAIWLNVSIDGWYIDWTPPPW